jgi:hypothetical protein
MDGVQSCSFALELDVTFSNRTSFFTHRNKCTRISDVGDAISQYMYILYMQMMHIDVVIVHVIAWEETNVYGKYNVIHVYTHVHVCDLPLTLGQSVEPKLEPPGAIYL